jgi:hypothetical protein
MSKILLSGGCSFTFGNELSDDNGKIPSKKSWAALLANKVQAEYISVAFGGLGNQGIARRVFEYVCNYPNDDMFVTVMWTFTSRYDWAMPRNAMLEKTRWATITPWDVSTNQLEVQKQLAGSTPQLEEWRIRRENLLNTGVTPFADALYRYAANQYHEAYLSWKSITWLQNILEKKKIPYMFTLADNTLFWDEFKPLTEADSLLTSLHKEIDFTKWFTFGERDMGFNQWAILNNFPRATTHPLDIAHQEAVQLMENKFMELYNQPKEQK